MESKVCRLIGQEGGQTYKLATVASSGALVLDEFPEDGQTYKLDTFIPSGGSASSEINEN